MRTRRRPAKANPKLNTELFQKLPDHLQKAIKKALEGSEENLSSLKPPAGGPSPGAPGAPPPVLFFGWEHYLSSCSRETLLEIAGNRAKWYGMEPKHCAHILQRLGWTMEELHRWQDQDPPQGAEWHGSLGEWNLKYGVRTDREASEDRRS
jgi:hypothetical protein